eukprot:10729981-Lingulodinium_polyedra.AAC.1
MDPSRRARSQARSPQELPHHIALASPATPIRRMLIVAHPLRQLRIADLRHVVGFAATRAAR